MNSACWFWLHEYRVTPELITAVLDRVAQAGIGTVIYYGVYGEAQYASELLPVSSLVTADFAPLPFVVEQGHARGLQVEAWWSVGTVMSNGQLRGMHPGWDIATLAEIPDDVHWLNFSLPEVRQFVSDVAVEIAENCGVDGVHLDYIRFPVPPPYKEGSCESLVDCRDFFSPEEVPATVQSAYQHLKASKPTVQLTAAVMAGQGGSANHLQNWADWLAGDYIDLVRPMAYIENPAKLEDLRRWIGEWQGLIPERVDPALIMYNGSGSSKVLKTPEQLLEEITLCQEAGFGDLCFFHADVMTDAQISFLAKTCKGGEDMIVPKEGSLEDKLRELKALILAEQEEFASVQTAVQAYGGQCEAMLAKMGEIEPLLETLKSDLAG
jgi:uncharacterized lipoprotein YddW (UPF0748 family)